MIVSSWLIAFAVHQQRQQLAMDDRHFHQPAPEGGISYARAGRRDGDSYGPVSTP